MTNQAATPDHCSPGGPPSPPAPLAAVPLAALPPSRPRTRAHSHFCATLAFLPTALIRLSLHTPAVASSSHYVKIKSRARQRQTPMH